MAYHLGTAPIELSLAVNSTMVGSLGANCNEIDVMTAISGTFFAVGSVGINAAPPSSGGIGHPLVASTYRNLAVTPNVDYIGAYNVTTGSVFVERRRGGKLAPTITSAAAVNAAENQTVVQTVVGYDADGAGLTYSISGGADAALFTINSLTGALSFIAAPDYETPLDDGGNNVYNVTVQVSDGALSTTKAIAVTVTAVNEGPTITSNGGAATAAVNAAENQTAVTTVQATDPDAGATITYSISGGADAAKFTIDSSTGVLAFQAAPNFESPTDANADNVYLVTVQASDGTLTDSQAISVTVTNVNEAPVITSNGGGPTAAISVEENQTAVTTVQATDVDASATITYSISGGTDAAKFTIVGATGVLTFVDPPDFETPTDGNTDNVYEVTVQASDGTLTDTQAISVTVTDVAE